MPRTRELVVSLKAESAELKKGLDQANARLDAFAKAAEKTGNVLAGAFAFDVLRDAAVAVAGFVKQGADAADKMGELAQSVGVPVDELSRLAYAASLSGSSTEEMGAALGRLAKQMGEAHAGGAAQVRLFEALGVSITDASGSLRSSGDVFLDVAERFASLEDGAAKTALAQEVFGKSGAALIPVLNEGKAGLQRLSDEAERFGLVVTEQGAQGAAAFNDALDRLHQAGQGLATRVAQELAPSMATLAEQMLDTSTNADTFSGTAEVLATGLRLVASTATVVLGFLEGVGTALAGLASTAWDLLRGDLEGAKESFLEGFAKETTKKVEASLERLKAIWDKKGPGEHLEKDAEKSKGSADKIVRNLGRVSAAADEARRAVERLGDAFDDQVRAELALGRQREGIQRDVAGRYSDAGPTQGFESFDSALKTLADSLEAEAVWRKNARELDRAGQILEADAAERNADALKALAERASKAADAFVELERAAGEVGGAAAGGAALDALSRAQAAGAVPGQLAGMLSATGPATSAAIQGVQTGAAAGPVGAVVGGLVGLLSQSEQFGAALDGLEGIFQALADSVGALVAPLLPLLDVVGALGQGLGALFEALSPLVEFVARPLYEVLKAFATVVLGIVKFIGDIINSIARVFGGKGFDMSGVDEAMRSLSRSSYDSARAQDQVAEASREVGEGIVKQARGFKVSLARFNAVNAEDRPAANPDGSTGTRGDTVVNVTLDGREIVRAVQVEQRQGNLRRGGTTGDRASPWG